MTDDLGPEEQEFLAEWKRKRRRRRLRALLIVAGVVLALVALAFVGVLVYGWYWQGKLDEEVARMRAQGTLLTWQQVLDRGKDLPAEKNSALVYLKAFGQLQDTPQAKVTEGLDEDLGARPSPTTMDLLASVAKADAQGLATIFSAVPLSEGCYPLEATGRDPWVLPPLRHCKKVSSAAQLCGRLAGFHAAGGRPAEAAQCLTGALGLASSFGSKEAVLEHQVRCATDVRTVAALERSLALCQLGAEELRTLRAGLLREGSDRSIAWGQTVTRSHAHYVLASARRSSPRTGRAGFGIIPGVRQRVDFLYQTAADEAARLAALPPREAIAGMAPHTATLADEPVPVEAVWLGYYREMQTEMKARMLLSVAAAALAVEQYRLEHGRWPDSLDQLVPEFLDSVPDDYFGSGKLRYVHTGQGVTVYSVGPDGSDDGGALEQRTFPSPPTTYDLPFRLLDPELRGAKTATFRDEVVDSGLSPTDLAAAGLNEEALKRLGLSDSDVLKLWNNQ